VLNIEVRGKLPDEEDLSTPKGVDVVKGQKQHHHHVVPTHRRHGTIQQRGAMGKTTA
jgi:hypothetical protein